MFDGAVDTADYAFNPQRIAVPSGTTITWQNSGAVIRTATGQNHAWDTGDIRAGQAASLTFDRPGVYLYNRTPHPWMLGELTVQ